MNDITSQHFTLCVKIIKKYCPLLPFYTQFGLQGHVYENRYKILPKIKDMYVDIKSEQNKNSLHFNVVP